MRESFGAKDVKNVKNVSKLRRLARNGSGIMIVYSTLGILPILGGSAQKRYFLKASGISLVEVDKGLENLAFPHVKRPNRANTRICGC